MHPLCFLDAYQKEFTAKIISLREGKFIVLDKTAFYAQGGGQAFDTGSLRRADGALFKVVAVRWNEGNIEHEVEKEGMAQGESVHGAIDWERRYRLMRMHTATHVFHAVIYKACQALITGNELQPDQSRMDLTLENCDIEKMKEYSREANKLIANGAAVKTYFMKSEDAAKISGLVKLAHAAPKPSEELRIVELEGIDIEADGGTHVRDIKEVGEIMILKMENKGKGRKRVYFALKP